MKECRVDSPPADSQHLGARHMAATQDKDLSQIVKTCLERLAGAVEQQNTLLSDIRDALSPGKSPGRPKKDTVRPERARTRRRLEREEGS